MLTTYACGALLPLTVAHCVAPGIQVSQIYGTWSLVMERKWEKMSRTPHTLLAHCSLLKPLVPDNGLVPV